MSKVAVLIPCFNEEVTVEKVINDFRNILPNAEIYIYDNNSTDNTVLKAQKAQGGQSLDENISRVRVMSFVQCLEI